MLATVAVVFGGFFALIYSSYRSARSRAQRGEHFHPEGKLRWPEDHA